MEHIPNLGFKGTRAWLSGEMFCPARAALFWSLCLTHNIFSLKIRQSAVLERGCLLFAYVAYKLTIEHAFSEKKIKLSSNIGF